jgi:hypothetical protein
VFWLAIVILIMLQTQRGWTTSRPSCCYFSL